MNTLRCALLLLLAWPLASADTPAHPFLLANKAEIAAAKAKAERQPWAKAALDKVLLAADRALKASVVPPDKVGQWGHWYSCPDHGVTLVTVNPAAHRCPVDGHVFTGDPYDAVIIGREHQRLAQSVLQLGLAWQFTADSRYAKRAAEILLGYAGKYSSYPRHDIRGADKVGGGKVLAQTLDEAVWLIPLSQGYDFVWDTLTPDERQRIEEGVLLPAAAVIREHRMAVHNIQCWKNSAVGLVGLVTGNEELVRDAVDDPGRGFRRQIAAGVTEDGLWFEGSMGYHEYTMQALWPLAEAMRHAGVDLYSDRYRTMYTAPLNLALPDGTPPGFNDSGGGRVQNLAGIYELAFARWKTPEFGAVVAGAATAATGAVPRDSVHALLFGAEQLPENTSVIPSQSVIMRDAGFAMLRVNFDQPAPAGASRAGAAPGPAGPRPRGSDAGAGEAARAPANRVDALAVRFGRHGGGHGHPDKPGIVFYAAGQLLALDPGSILYGNPLHAEWYRTTVAHNTVVVDGKPQANTDGALESWEPGTGPQGKLRLVAIADRAYPGVRMRRALSLARKGDSSIVSDAFTVSSNTEHAYDWVLHVSGDVAYVTNLRFVACEPPEKANGYQHIEKWECAEPDSDLEAAWLSGNVRLVLRMKYEPGTMVYRGFGPGKKPDERVPLILVRRRAAKTVFNAELEAAPAK